MKSKDLSEAARLIAEDIENEHHGLYESPNAIGEPDFSDKKVVLKQTVFARWIGKCLEQVAKGKPVYIRRRNKVFEVRLHSVDKVYVRHAGYDGRRNWTPPHESVLPDSLRGDHE